MIVEIIGSPGLGKTTTASLLDDVSRESDADFALLSFADYRRLDREIGEAGIMRKGRMARCRMLAPMCWRRPRLVLSVGILTVLHGRPFLHRARKAQRLIAHALFTERLQTMFPDEICVHHDGFMQCLWSTVIDSRALRGKTMIRSIMRDYYGRVRPRMILLELDDTLVTSRVFGRTSAGRFNRESSSKQRAEFDRWLNYYRELVSLLPNDLDMTRIEADAPPAIIADRVFSVLRANALMVGATDEARSKFLRRSGGNWTK
jgi:thymidylate kinase